MAELKKAIIITHVLYAVLHQRRELGLLAFQEAANERLLEDVHQVDRSRQTTKHLCGVEGSFTITIFSRILSLVLSSSDKHLQMQPSGSGPLRAAFPSNEYRQLHHGSPLAEGKVPNRPVVFTVHLLRKTSLFLQVSGAVALTVISWPGLLYTFDQKERSLFFETFLKFLGAFRSLNNYKLRLLVGGLYNVDLKVMRGGKKQHDSVAVMAGDPVLEVS